MQAKLTNDRKEQRERDRQRQRQREREREEKRLNETKVEWQKTYEKRFN